jgi:hypothetical protein
MDPAMGMVPLMTVSSSFEAKVVVARLGSEGILFQTRGSLDSVYPLGNVTILVPAAELDAARDVLMVDEIEHAFSDIDADDEPEVGRGPWTSRPAWRVAAVAGLLALVVVAARTLLGGIPG